MNRLVAVAMLATVVAIVVELADGDARAWTGWVSLALAGAAFALAGVHTVPAAVRLGRRGHPPEVQSSLARAILRDHLACLAAIAAVVAIRLGFAT
jgi:hypothetical protein